MTTSADNRTENYPGAGSTGPFTFDFPVDANTEIIVTKYDSSNNPTTLSLVASSPGATEYTNTLTSGGAAGGSVNLGAALAVGETLNIQGSTPVSQGISFVNQGAFFAEKHETAYDKLTRIVQEINRDTGRSIRYSSLDDDNSVDPVLPPLSANTAVVVNATADGFDLVSFASLVGSVDTQFSGLASGDFLRYNGTYWINRTASEARTDLGLGALAILGTVDTAQIEDDSITTAKLDAGAVTSTEVDSTVAVTNASQVFAGGQRATLTELTDGATITPDFNNGNDFYVQLGGNRTLANPSNAVAGQSGSIDIFQDDTGSRTLAYAWGWQFAGGTAPTLTTTACGRDTLYYDVRVAQSSAVTITIASPGVVSYTAHGLYTGQQIQLTTTGALPTGLTASTTYYVIEVDADSFQLATSLANAAAGTAINTSGTQSGTHTLTALTINLAATLEYE